MRRRRSRVRSLAGLVLCLSLLPFAGGCELAAGMVLHGIAGGLPGAASASRRGRTGCRPGYRCAGTGRAAGPEAPVDCQMAHCARSELGSLRCAPNGRVVIECVTRSDPPCLGYFWSYHYACPRDPDHPERGVAPPSDGVAPCLGREPLVCPATSSLTCDGATVLSCADDGSCRRRGECTGENPICVETSAGGAACVHEGSESCDPATFGAASGGLVCERDRILGCPPSSGLTAVVERCAAGAPCVVPEGGGEARCAGGEVDEGAQPTEAPPAGAAAPPGELE